MKYLCILLFFALFNSAAFCQVSIIGAATPAANWNADVDLVETGTGTNIWTGTFALSASELKFRRNRSWDPANNWGGASFPNGAAVPNGANIVVATAGVYAISLNLNTLTYTFTLVPASNLGINTTSPNQRLHVEGKLKIGDDPNPPTAGTVRWNEATKDFEGYDGTVWRSLTRTNSANWGANYISQKENQKGSVFNVGVVDVYKGMGNSVSSSGFNFLAGAPVSVTSGQTGRGKASIFTEGTNTNWDLQAADGAAGERFGSSVSISGDYAVVGANFADISGREEQGAAYVFRRASSTQWLQEAKITAPDGTAYDYFGHSVSISGNTIVVGAYGHEFGPNASQGAAYVFTRSGTTWPLQAKLIAPDGSSSDNFGNSVSIAGDYVIVGAAGDDVDGKTNQGSAYIFKRTGTTWSQQAKITSIDGEANDNFGTSVSMIENYAVVGAPSDAVNEAFHVFVRDGSTWRPHARVNRNAGDNDFGRSVSIYQDNIVVGAPLTKFGTQNTQGVVYVYRRNGTGWVKEAMLTASDGAAVDRFGIAVHISEIGVVVGANGHDEEGNPDQGAVYLFKKN